MAHRFISPFGFGPLGTPRPISDLPGDELHDPELQAAFNLDPVSNEKPIIQVVSFVEQRLIEELHKHPDLFKDMDRRRFEEIVAELFDGFGYAVELTKRTRDGGKDVIAIKRAEVDVRFLISCKRTDPGNPVRVGAVRELHSVKESERATKGIIATTTHFTQDARLLVEKHQWELELRDFEAVKEWVAAYLRIKGK